MSVKISAVVVTKGDQDISRICSSLSHFDEVIVWDNSKNKDLKVYGRFAGAQLAHNDLVYTQDDDCIIPSKELSEEFGPSDSIITNFPKNRRSDYSTTGISLIGWGSIFPKHMMSCFKQYLDKYPFDDLFLRECDRIFTYLNRENIRWIDLEIQQLSHAFGTDRMGREERHGRDLQTIHARLRAL